MFNSPHLVYCNCASAPLLYCPSVHSMWNCSIPNPSPVYRASLDAMATHSGPSAQEENTEAISASRNLKFGIENILYGTLQSGRSLRKMQNVTSLLNSSLRCIFCQFNSTGTCQPTSLFFNLILRTRTFRLLLYQRSFWCF